MAVISEMSNVCNFKDKLLLLFRIVLYRSYFCSLFVSVDVFRDVILNCYCYQLYYGALIYCVSSLARCGLLVVECSRCMKEITGE